MIVSVINPVMINGEFFNLRTGPKIEKIIMATKIVIIQNYGACRLSGVSD